MTKEGYIENIQKKLVIGMQLDDKEISTVIAALRESKHCYQKPYFEVVFHDKYGNQQSRIMNPDFRDSKEEPFGDGLYMINDKFSIDFKRLVHEEDRYD